MNVRTAGLLALTAVAAVIPATWADPGCNTVGCWEMRPYAWQIDEATGDTWVLFERSDLIDDDADNDPASQIFDSCPVGKIWLDAAARPAIRIVPGDSRDAIAQSVIAATLFDETFVFFSVFDPITTGQSDTSMCAFKSLSVRR